MGHYGEQSITLSGYMVFDIGSHSGPGCLSLWGTSCAGHGRSDPGFGSLFGSSF